MKPLWPACLAASLLLGGGGTLPAQTQIDLSRQAKTIDFSSAAWTKPSKTGAALPAQCTLAESFFLTTAPAGQNLYLCTATNVWTLSSGAGEEVPLVSEGSVVRLKTSTDQLSIGSNINPAKLTVVGTTNQVQGIVRSYGTQNQDIFQWQKGDGSLLARIDKDGFLTQGMGALTGHHMQLGNISGDINRSSLTISPGNSAALPPFLRMLDHLGNNSFLFPCGGLSGRWCQDSLAPGTAYVNPLLSRDSTDTGIIGKSFAPGGLTQESYSIWTEVEAPSAAAAGTLRVYGRAGAICWVNSSGTETCAGASAISSVFGRTGAVTAQAGDYDASQVTNAVDRTTANTYTAGQKQTFQASLATAGINVACAELPSSPADGDMACDSGDGNKIKLRSNGQWVDPGSGGGLGDPNANGIVVRDAENNTVARSLMGQNGISVTNGDGQSGNPTIELAALVSSAGQGYWLPFGFPHSAWSTPSGSANQHRLWQFVLPARLTINEIVYEVGTAAPAGTAARIVIWNSACNSRVIDTGALTGSQVESTGVKTVAVSGGPVTLNPGIYYVGYASESGTTVLRAYASAWSSTIGPFLNNSTNTRAGTGAAAGGNGAGFDLPAACGTITAVNGQQPIAVMFQR